MLLKPLKIAIFGPNLLKNRDYCGPQPKQTRSVSVEMTKADHKLSKMFYFIKISYVICFDWVMNDFLFCGDVFLLKRIISSHNSCDHILWFLVHLCKIMISSANFFIFQNFDFWGFQEGKREKSDLKLPISVCFALYLRNCRLYQDFDNDIYRCFSLFFLKKCNIINIKIILFLLAHFNSFFDIFFQ